MINFHRNVGGRGFSSDRLEREEGKKTDEAIFFILVSVFKMAVAWVRQLAWLSDNSEVLGSNLASDIFFQIA